MSESNHAPSKPTPPSSSTPSGSHHSKPKSNPRHRYRGARKPHSNRSDDSHAKPSSSSSPAAPQILTRPPAPPSDNGKGKGQAQSSRTSSKQSSFQSRSSNAQPDSNSKSVPNTNDDKQQQQKKKSKKRSKKPKQPQNTPSSTTNSKDPNAPTPEPTPPPPPPGPSKEELARIAAEEARIKRENEERERLKKEHEERISNAVTTLTTITAVTKRHAASRENLSPLSLSQSRETHLKNKKDLKSDHKKCTAFVKKIKSGGWASSSSAKETDVEEDMTNAPLVKDVRTLNLSRYIDEVASGLLEAKLKIGDLPLVVALCTAMHERYEDFLPALLPPLTALLKGKGGGDDGGGSGAERMKEVARQRRIGLRLLTEFLLNGLVSEPKSVVRVISDASGAPSGDSATSDSGANYNVNDATIIVSFVKAAGHEIFGVPSRSVRLALQTVQSEVDRLREDNPDETAKLMSLYAQTQKSLDMLAITPEASTTLRTHVTGAYRTLCNNYVSTHTKLRKLEKRCEQDRLLAGSLSETREKGLADARKLLETLKKSVETIAEALDEKVPEIKEEEEEGTPSGVGLELWTGDEEREGEAAEKLGPFDDEETREFYRDLPDLLERIPPALLGMSPAEVEQMQALNIQRYGAEESVSTEGLEDDKGATTEDTSYDESSTNEDTEDDSTSKDNATNSSSENKDTPHYKLTLLLEAELPEMNRRERTDELAEKFCVNHGASKPSRKRLTKALFLVPRTRMDLLPYYARLAAILDRVFSDVGPPLVHDLEQQFHGLARWKKNVNSEGRTKNARLLGELTKFRVAPPIVVLRGLKRCLDDFSGFNIDVACCLLETCGRYLNRMEHTKDRLGSLMETMMRLRKAKNLDDRICAQIDSAFFMVTPPTNAHQRKVKVLPPVEAYMKYLFMELLSPVTESNVSFVVKQIQRLPWNSNNKCGFMVVKYMLKACRKGQFSAVNGVAEVAAGLKRTRPEVPTRLIDAVIEEIQWSMENPNFRDGQRLLIMTRLLGELHKSALVPTTVVFDFLHHFLDLGHEIPPALRDVSEKADNAANNKGDAVTPPPRSITQTIHEDDEFADDSQSQQQQPAVVAVSKHSKYDPRVPSIIDPPQSITRVKQVITLLETVGRSTVTSTNISKLHRFLASFQRYLFTKSHIPADVEFALLDLFDHLDSHLQDIEKRDKSVKTGNNNNNNNNKGFIRYNNWLDAHNATIKAEEAEALLIERSRVKLLALGGGGGDTDDVSADPLEDEDRSIVDDETLNTDSKEDDTASISDHEVSRRRDSHTDGISSSSSISDDASSIASDDSSSGGGSSADTTTVSFDEDDEDDDEEIDEATQQEAHMRQLENDAFERELRKITMEALEKGKIAARTGTGGKVADTMVHASQFVGKKTEQHHHHPEAVLTTTATTTDQQDDSGSQNVLGGGDGISFKLLKRGHKGRVEAKYFAVPKETNLAKQATQQNDEAAKERDMLKARVLQYEVESAEQAYSGNVYMDQAKLTVIRNRPLSMEDIDRNFGVGSAAPGGGNNSSGGGAMMAGGGSGSVSSSGRGRGGGGRMGGEHGGRGSRGGRMLRLW